MSRSTAGDTMPRPRAANASVDEGTSRDRRCFVDAKPRRVLRSSQTLTGVPGAAGSPPAAAGRRRRGLDAARGVGVQFVSVPADADLVLVEVASVGASVFLQVEGVEVQAVHLSHRVLRVGTAGPAQQGQGRSHAIGSDEELLLHTLAQRCGCGCARSHADVQVGRCLRRRRRGIIADSAPRADHRRVAARDRHRVAPGATVIARPPLSRRCRRPNRPGRTPIDKIAGAEKKRLIIRFRREGDDLLAVALQQDRRAGRLYGVGGHPHRALLESLLTGAKLLPPAITVPPRMVKSPERRCLPRPRSCLRSTPGSRR